MKLLLKAYRMLLKRVTRRKLHEVFRKEIDTMMDQFFEEEGFINDTVAYEQLYHMIKDYRDESISIYVDTEECAE